MKKTKKRAHGISRISREYLYKRFINLYLHSREARTAFFYLVFIKKDKEHNSRLIRREFFAARSLYSRSSLIRFAVFFGLIIILQLVYPKDRAMPFSRLQDNGYVGFTTEEQIAAKFYNFDTRTVTVHTHTRSLTTSFTDLGVQIDIDGTINNLSNYSARERLIPFSIFFKGNKTFSAARDIDSSKLDLYVKDLVTQTDKQPVDAKIELNETKLNVIPAEDGYAYKRSELESQVVKSGLSDKSTIVFSPTILPPAISTELARQKADQMQARINNPLTINNGDKSMILEPKVIASWVEVLSKPENKNIELAFNKDKITASIKSFAGVVNVASTPTVITTLNGMDAGRREGITGKSLQFEDLVDRISKTTTPSTASIEAQVTSIPPVQTYDRRYSKDSYGMQTLLSYWASNNRGQYGIDFRSSNGKILANVNPYGQFKSSGIYRLYVAHLTYGRINAGSLSGGSMTAAGHTVSACLDKMIYDGNEACSSALGSIVGWSGSDHMLHSQGFENTSLSSGAGVTTANDTSDWLSKLLDGSLMTSSQAATLKSVMGRSTGRSGIPAGSPGLAVSSKSGASGGTRHDVGVVYHPGGTYALSILSEGSSFTQIADLTREINRVMTQ